MVLVRAQRVVGALLAVVLAAGVLAAASAPSASAAPLDAPVAVSLVVTGTSRVDETSVLSVSLSDPTATGYVDLRATDRTGRFYGFGEWPVSGGKVSRPVKISEFGTWTIVANYLGDATHQAASSQGVPVTIKAWLGEVVISQIRTSGPGGAGDYYVEITNTGRGSVRLAGFTLVSGSGTRTVLPYYAPFLGTGKHYLATGKAFSLGGVATPDLSGYLGTGGFTVIAPDEAGTVTDAVGPVAGPHRGRPLPTISGPTPDQWAFLRIRRVTQVVDTGNNADDFVLVSSTGGKVGGVPSIRGSASPSGLLDPVRSNAFFRSSLLDPTAAAGALPNRRYVPGSPARLEIRRTITNTSDRSITRARVRVTSLSEADGLPYPGGSQPAVPAQLRLVDPATPTTEVTFEDRPSVTVHNLKLDPPAGGASGGGLNSTLTVPLPDRGLAPGASVTVGFTFEVDVRGTYWFGYDVEAFTKYYPGGSRTASARPATTLESSTARAVTEPAAVVPLVRGTL